MITTIVKFMKRSKSVWTKRSKSVWMRFSTK